MAASYATFLKVAKERYDAARNRVRVLSRCNWASLTSETFSPSIVFQAISFLGGLGNGIALCV